MVTTVESNNRLESPYELWAAKEGIPIVRGYAVKDTCSIPLEPWARKGGKGSLIHLEGGEGYTSAYVCEIAPGTSLKPQKQMFEERIYILQGEGKTVVRNAAGREQSFSWSEYSAFSPPLNAWHQLSNTGERPAKYVAVTNAPLIINIYRNPDFVFNNSFAFKERYDGQTNYFDGIGEIINQGVPGRRPMWRGGFIRDVRKVRTSRLEAYGGRFASIQLNFSENSMEAHLGQIDVGDYKKPHRHVSGAHLITLQGTGFVVMWDDWSQVVKEDFQKGSIYCPPNDWWHTHTNTGTEEVRQIAFRWDMFGIGKMHQKNLSLKKGGDSLEREEEPPELFKLFEAELAKKGLKPR